MLGRHLTTSRLASYLVGNSLTENFSYNAYGALKSYSASPYSFSLTFAPDWNVISANDSVNGNWTYAYDQFNRLSSSNKNQGQQTFSYDYDRYGNRLHQNAPQGGPAPQYAFDNNNHISGSGVTYDALGNMMSDGLGNTYMYDAENRLISVNGGATATYSYDAEGRRVGAPGAEYLYDQAGRPVTLFDLSAVWSYGEIYAGGRHLATYSKGTTNFMHTDWLGTKRAMTSMAGANSETCTGLPFGDGVNCTGTDWNFNLFTDDMHDSETNLEHTWFRQYSGTQGRFVIPDPFQGSMDLTNPQSLNRYAYVMNSPLNFIDPLGLVWYCVGVDNFPEVCSWEPDPRDTHDSCKDDPWCQPNGNNGREPGSGPGGGGGGVHGNNGPKQTFSQCMTANSSTFSLAGLAQDGVNAVLSAFGKSVDFKDTFLAQLLGGNSVSGLLFGSPADAAMAAGSNTPGILHAAMGTATTYGRRTSTIMSLNIAGKGGLPQALSSASSGLKSVLGVADSVLSLGMSLTTRLEVDAALAGLEAAYCAYRTK